MKKLFLEKEMTIKRVIIFAVLTAIITAVFNVIPFFDNTSFQDIAINLDLWIIFALYIILNCNSEKEAAIKTFIFFLISQPLIYLIEVPFNSLGFGLFKYYIYWAKITVLTIPGAIIAYQLKRKNWLSVAVLSVAVAYYGYISSGYFWNVISNFPHHLLSLILCILIALFLIFTLFEKKIHKVVLTILLILSLILPAIYYKPTMEVKFDLYNAAWTYVVEDKDVVDVYVENNQTMVFHAKKDGRTYVRFMDSFGVETEYYVTVSNGSLYVNQFD